jgi:DNA-directed RNA polymerase subunit alpha
VTQDILDTMIGAGGASADPMAAQRHFEAGAAAEAEGNRVQAIEEYRAAAQLGGDAAHVSLALYEQLSGRERPHMNALLNLAVLYEDRGDISRAEKCLKQILDTNPNHERARLFWKDVQASKDMYYDEEHARDLAKHNALLDTPVTDFELSVRARNCLKKMQIRTLGDLLKISEAELLSYKNFGETSLVEIKQMLSAKGLRLGQGLEGQYSRARKEIYEELRGRAPESVLNKPISVLDLSVRARKAIQILSIQTIGDLATRTEAELMGVKNFGATSLVEIREKLKEFGLELRTLE